MEKIGRLIEIKYGKYLVYTNKQLFLCSLKGSLKQEKIVPTVGDIVKFDSTNVIISIYKRKNIMIRPMIANVDKVLIVQSLKHPNISLSSLVKLLAFYESKNIDEVIIIFTKFDLLKDKNEFNWLINDLKKDHYKVYLNDQINEIKNEFKNSLVCLVGQSGVGKSTLINNIIPSSKQKTQEISQWLKRGKQTTTSVKLIPFNNGFLADTPGFSAINLNMTQKEFSKSFNDFHKYSTQCKFNDCLHQNESGCAIINKVNDNKISQWRYEEYLRILSKLKK